MRELTPTQLQNEDSLEFVSWHNTAFWLTNRCKPHHFLMYINGFIFWVVLFPFSLFVALPYRLTRRIFCEDSRINLKTALKFTANSKDTVAVYVWFTEKPLPGTYRKHGKYFSLRAATVFELKSFAQNCNEQVTIAYRWYQCYCQFALYGSTSRENTPCCLSQ